MEQQIITAHTQNFEKEPRFLETLKITANMVTLQKRNKCYLILVYLVILYCCITCCDYAE